MTATILQFPTTYRIAWHFHGLDGMVQLEGGKVWMTHDKQEAEWQLCQLRNKFAGRIVFWLREGNE